MDRKKFKEVKGYKNKIKRHRDAILKLHSVDGDDSELLISGSADHTVRGKLEYFLTVIVWNLKEHKLSK